MAKQIDPSLEQAMSEWQDKQTAGKPIQIIQAGGVAPDSSEVVVKRAAPASSIQGSGYTPGQMYATVVGESQTEQMANMLGAIAQGVQTGMQFVDMKRQNEERERREQYRQNEEQYRKDENTANSIILGEINQYKVGNQIFTIPENATELDRQKAAVQFMSGINYDWDQTGWMKSQQQSYLLRLGRSIDVDERELDSNQKTDEREYAKSLDSYFTSILNELPSSAEIRRGRIFATTVPGLGITLEELIDQSQEKAASGQELLPTHQWALNFGADLTNRSIQEAEDLLVDQHMGNLKELITTWQSATAGLNGGMPLPQVMLSLDSPLWIEEVFEGLLQEPTMPNLISVLNKIATSDEDGNPIELLPNINQKIKYAVSTLISQNEAKYVIENMRQYNTQQANSAARARSAMHIKHEDYTSALSELLNITDARNIPQEINNFFDNLLLSNNSRIFVGLATSFSYDKITSNEGFSNRLLKELNKDTRFAPFIKQTSDGKYTINPERSAEWNGLIANIIYQGRSFNDSFGETVRRILNDTASKDGLSTSQRIDYQVGELAKRFSIDRSTVIDLLSKIAKIQLEKAGKDPDDQRFDLNALTKIGSAFLFSPWESLVNSEFFSDNPINFSLVPSIDVNTISTKSIEEAVFLRGLSAVRTMDGSTSSEGMGNVVPGTNIPISGTSLGSLWRKVTTTNNEPSPIDIERAVDEAVTIYQRLTNDSVIGNVGAIHPATFENTLKKANIPDRLIDLMLPTIIDLFTIDTARNKTMEFFREREQEQDKNLIENVGITKMSDVLSFSSDPKIYISADGFQINNMHVNDDVTGRFNIVLNDNGRFDDETSAKVARRVVFLQRTLSSRTADPNWKNTENGRYMIEKTQGIVDTVFSMADGLMEMRPDDPRYRGHQAYVFAMIDAIRAATLDQDSNLYGISDIERLRLLAGTEQSQLSALLLVTANPLHHWPTILKLRRQMDSEIVRHSPFLSAFSTMGRSDETRETPIATAISRGAVVIPNSNGSGSVEANIVQELIPIIGLSIDEDDVVDSLSRVLINPMAESLGIESDEMIFGYNKNKYPIKWKNLSSNEKIAYALTLLPRANNNHAYNQVLATVSRFNQTLRDNQEISNGLLGTSVNEKLDNYWRVIVGIASPGLTEANLTHRRLSPSGISPVTPVIEGTNAVRMSYNGIDYRTVPAKVTTQFGTYTGEWLTKRMPKPNLETTNRESIDGATFLWNGFLNDTAKQKLIAILNASLLMPIMPNAIASPRIKTNFQQFNEYITKDNITFGDAIIKMAELGLHPQSAAIMEKVRRWNRDPNWSLNKELNGTYPLRLNLRLLESGELPTLSLGGLVITVVTDDMFGGRYISALERNMQGTQGRFTFGGY